MKSKVLTSRETQFCTALVADPKRNATAAAISAGYARGSARITASRLLTRANIRAQIAQLEAFAAERARLTVADVIDRYSAIFRADPNDLTSYEIGACRYCHGIGHAWQWRTPGEFERALSAWHATPEGKRPPTPPTDDGSYGYSRKLSPHPDCPECDGDGEGRVVLHDTRTDHPLFAGVRETRHGIEIRLHDRMAALEILARILGAFEKDNRQQGPDESLSAFLHTLINENRAQGAVLNRGDSLNSNQQEQEL